MTQILIALVLMALLAVIGLAWFTWNTKRGAEVAIPPKGAFLDLPGGRLHYTDEGNGPAIVMIHGLGGQMGNFTLALSPLLTDSHRVIVLDRPGMGYSERGADAPANPRAQAQTVVQVIDALGLDRPLVVGHSLGGAIALCLAMEHPDKTRGLALLAPLTQPPGGPIKAFNGLDIKNSLLRYLLSWTIAIPMSIRTAPMVLDQVFGPDPIPDDYAVKGGALLGLRPASFRNTARDYMGSGRDLRWMAAQYDSLNVPVRILYGADDRILEADLHGTALVEKHPHIGLEVVAGGHMLPVTRAQDCARFIRDTEAAIAAKA
ncbi:MAG: alpha/beta fold hydrolase [Rhodobacterales bacterium]